MDSTIVEMLKKIYASLNSTNREVKAVHLELQLIRDSMSKEKDNAGS